MTVVSTDHASTKTLIFINVFKAGVHFSTLHSTIKIWQVSLGALFFSVFGVMFVDERGNGNRKCFSRIIVLQRRGCNFRSVSWCCGRVQSPNDVAQKIEKSLKNTHITIQRQLTIWCSAKPQNTPFLEFNQLSIVESIFNKKCVLVAGIFGWWYNFSDIEKAAVIGGPLLFIMILIIACCCCCGCCRSRPTNQGAVIVTPAAVPTAVMATSTRSTVPMKPLVNEAWVSLQSRRTRSLLYF